MDVPGLDADLQRSRGAVSLRLGPGPGGGRLLELAQRSPGRALFPRAHGGRAPEVVLLNTAGGLTGGDRLEVVAALEPDAAATLTSQAAEKLYRARDGDARVATTLRVGAGARLGWLPQETILFDGARLSRALDADVAPGGTLVAAEILVLGRIARGERVTRLSLIDRWMIRRDGRLVWADAFRCTGDTDPAALRAPSLLGDARALAMLVGVCDDVSGALAALRAVLVDDGGEGASLVNGILVARRLDPDPTRLRARVAVWLGALADAGVGSGPPRAWSL